MSPSLPACLIKASWKFELKRLLYGMARHLNWPNSVQSQLLWSAIQYLNIATGGSYLISAYVTSHMSQLFISMNDILLDDEHFLTIFELSYWIVKNFGPILLTPAATAERSVAAASVYGLLGVGIFIFLFSLRFSLNVLNRSAWNLATIRGLGPKEIIESFIAIAFLVF